MVPSPALWLTLAQRLAPGALLPNLRLYVDQEPRCSRIIALADCLLDDNQIAEARWVTEQAEHLDQVVFHGRYRGEVDRLRGRLAFAVGDFEAAAYHFSRMVRSADRRGTALRRGRAAYDYGLVLVQRRQWADALESLFSARRFLQNAHATMLEGQCEWAIGTTLVRIRDYRSAQRHYERAVTLLEEDQTAVYPAFGVLLCQWANGGTDALPAMIHLLERAPKHLRPKIQHQVAVMLRDRQEPMEALVWLDKALAELGPEPDDWVDVQCERMVCLCLTGQTEIAREVWGAVMDKKVPVEEHNAMSLAIAGLMLGGARETRLPVLGAPHHEQRVEALLAWAKKFVASEQPGP